MADLRESLYVNDARYLCSRSVPAAFPQPALSIGLPRWMSPTSSYSVLQHELFPMKIVVAGDTATAHTAQAWFREGNASGK